MNGYSPLNMFQNPLLGLGIGLLQGAAPGGTLASGANLGLRNMMAMGQMQNQMARLKMMQDRFDFEQQQREQQQAAIDALTQPSREPFAADLFPGEAPIEGLATVVPAPLQGIDAQLLRAAPDEFLGQLIENRLAPIEPLTPSAAVKDAMALGLQPGTEPFNNYIRERTLKPQIEFNMGPKVPPGYYAPTGDPTQGVLPLPGSAPTQPTESQQNVDLLYKGMIGASDTIRELEADEDFDPSSMWDAAVVEYAPDIFESTLLGSKGQQYIQAQRLWVENDTYLKTGKAATEEEINNKIKAFFPQPGDSKETIQQKAESRRKEEEAARERAAPIKGQTAPTAGTDTSGTPPEVVQDPVTGKWYMRKR